MSEEQTIESVEPTPTESAAETPSEAPAETEAPSEPTPEVSWSDSVPEQYRRETPEETIAELSKAVQNANDLISKGEHKTPSTYETPEDVVKAAGLEIQDLVEKFQADGSLTDEQYAALAKVGRSRAEVDGFYRGQFAQQKLDAVQREQSNTQAAEAVGGEDRMNVLLEWANQTLPPDERAAIQKKNQSDPGAFVEIMKDIQQRYNKANGFDGVKPLAAADGNAQMSGGFATRREWQNAKAEAEAKYGRGKAREDADFVRREKQTDAKLFRNII